jgi:hypothetical protein
MEADEDVPRAADVGSMFWPRLAGTLVAAVALLWLCWLASGLPESEGGLLVLAGPVLLFRSPYVLDHLGGAVGVAVLLPCILAVGVRVNAVTIALSALAAVCWVGLAFSLAVAAGG